MNPKLIVKAPRDLINMHETPLFKLINRRTKCDMKQKMILAKRRLYFTEYIFI